MVSAELTKDLLSQEPVETLAKTFTPMAPREAERPRLPRRMRRQPLRSIEGIRQNAKNRYEAVLIASARARQLNAKKMALEERGLEEEVLALKRLKMTSNALGELLDGKIQVHRPEDAA